MLVPIDANGLKPTSLGIHSCREIFAGLYYRRDRGQIGHANDMWDWAVVTQFVLAENFFVAMHSVVFWSSD
jgi:hypothetical protein